MSITACTVHDIMDKLIKSREYSVNQWIGTRYEKVKSISSTDKGNLGEDLLAKMLEAMSYVHVSIDNSRRGGWDVRVQNGDHDLKFEVKVASLDIHGAHQFNGIRHDTEYTHLFLLGVLPDELRYKIISKRNRDDYTMTPMAKGTNSGYKITFRSQELASFDEFGNEIVALLGNP